MSKLWISAALSIFRIVVGVTSGTIAVVTIYFLLAAFTHAIDAQAATPNCSWDRPGHRPYMGSVPDAIDKYKDIPAEVRAALKKRMTARQYDEIATITRESIAGKDTRYTDLRQMHFGNGQVCATVSRSKWSAEHKERGLVYCERGHCVIVPTVCRNVSRVTLVPPVAPPAAETSFPPVTVIGGMPPGGNFTVPQAPELPYEPTFRTPAPAPWIVALPGPSHFFPVPILQPVVVVPPAPVAHPQPPAAPPVVPPGAAPSAPQVPPKNPPVQPPSPPVEPPVTPPVNPPWFPDQPVSPPVPEPSAAMLMLAGLGLLVSRHLRLIGFIALLAVAIPLLAFGGVENDKPRYDIDD